MLSNDVMFQVTVLTMLGILSLSVAISAKGPVRSTLAYGLFIINLGIVAAFFILKLNSLDNDLSKSLNPEYFEGDELIKEADGLPSTVAENEALKNNNQEQKVEAPKSKTDPIVMPSAEPEPAPAIDPAPIKTSFEAVQSKGIALASTLENFEIGELKKMSDDQYEAIRSTSNTIVNSSSALLREFNRIKNRNVLSDADRKLAQALNTLNQGARSLSGFFNAENGAEEAEFRTKYKRFGSQAHSQFKQALKGI